jgi:hypothetical protein
MFIVAPVVIGIGARKIYCRSGALWGFLALLTNVGISVYFDNRLGFRSFQEAADEMGIVLIMGTLFMLAALELLRHLPQEAASKYVFRRGVLRVWASLAVAWIILCAFRLPVVACNLYTCSIFWRAIFGPGAFEAGSLRTSYFDVAKAFIGIPMLGFVVGQVVCWVADGFRWTTPNSFQRAEPRLDVSDSASRSGIADEPVSR